MIPHLETLEAKTFVENISIKKETFPRCHPYDIYHMFRTLLYDRLIAFNLAPDPI